MPNQILLLLTWCFREYTWCLRVTGCQLPSRKGSSDSLGPVDICCSRLPRNLLTWWLPKAQPATTKRTQNASWISGTSRRPTQDLHTHDRAALSSSKRTSQPSICRWGPWDCTFPLQPHTTHWSCLRFIRFLQSDHHWTQSAGRICVCTAKSCLWWFSRVDARLGSFWLDKAAGCSFIEITTRITFSRYSSQWSST